MKSFVWALLVVVCVTLAAPVARAQVGIAAGLNFENLGDIKATDRSATFDNATGYHVGIFADLNAGLVSVRPGIFFRDFGDVKLRENGAERTLDLNLIEVPIDVRVNLLASAVRPYLMAGPVFGYANSNDDQLNESLRTVTVWGNAGFGVAVAVPGLGITLSPELRFAVGINRLIKPGEPLEIGATSLVADEVSRQSAVMLRLGLQF